MDILYLLIPLSVILVFLSWLGYGGPSIEASSKTSSEKVNEF